MAEPNYTSRKHVMPRGNHHFICQPVGRYLGSAILNSTQTFKLGIEPSDT